MLTLILNKPKIALMNNIDSASGLLKTFFLNHKFGVSTSETLTNITLILGLILICIIGYYIVKYIIIRTVHAVISKTKNKYDDEIIRYKVFEPLSHIAPAVILFYFTNHALPNDTGLKLISTLCYIYIIISVLITILRGLSAINFIFTTMMRQKQRQVSIKGYIQVIKIIFGVIAAILIISVIAGESPRSIIAGLAAMSAVTMLVFKDTLLGFVASIQLSAQKMLKINDWITVSDRNIDGNVIDITLNTIKVKNFDNSISTIPTYALVSESFINRSNMLLKNSRRIKRSIIIDVETVKKADKVLIDKICQIPFMKLYLEERINNNTYYSLNDSRFNNLQITNLELFRKYIELYIQSNFRIFKKYKPVSVENNNIRDEEYIVDYEEFIKDNGEESKSLLSKNDNGHYYINDIKNFLSKFKDNYIREDDVIYAVKKTTVSEYINGEKVTSEQYEKIIEKKGIFAENENLMIRLLDQTPYGIPLEIYCFVQINMSNDFEQIQSAFFEHLFSVIKEFDLKTCQYKFNVENSIE